MGCACNKRKRKPTQNKPTSGSSGSGSAGRSTQSFVLTTSTGKTLTFGSKLEADAANARSGYSGTVRRG